jgi:PDZ domain-containing protein
MPRWVVALFAGLFVMTGLSVAAWSVELPYFAFSPGPVGDALDAVHVEGDDLAVYPPDGELYFLTVSIVGIHGVNVYELVAAGLDPTVDIVARQLYRSDDETDEEYRQRNLNSMDRSKEQAIRAAQGALGIEIPPIESDGVGVVDLVEGAPAAEVLQLDDIIVEVDGTPITVADDIRVLLEGKQAGDLVSVLVHRAGDFLEFEFPLYEWEDGRAIIGISAVTINPQFPVDIQTGNIGGPSAGLMYTLAIIDTLSEGDLTKGHVVAGTGTIQASGEVGGIGGVRQKVVAAEAAGAEVMLVPESNYEDALTAERDTMELVPVSTLDDALAYLETLPER